MSRNTTAMLTFDKSKVIANSTNSEKYPKKCWSVMFFAVKMVTGFDFWFLLWISKVSPMMPKIITTIIDTKMIVFSTLNVKL